MESHSRISREITNESIQKKNVVRHDIINFRRKKISENEQLDTSQLEGDLIFLDTDTALEAEPLTVEIIDDDEEQETIYTGNYSELVDGDFKETEMVDFEFQNADIVAEELPEGKHPLDDMELEEGEVILDSDTYKRGLFRTYYSKYHKCPLCEKVFTQKGNLMRHYQTHTGARPFTCELCGHRFTQKSNLQKHIATHNGDKKFECGVCHKCFVQKANLIRHLRIHTGEKPFECELCGHKFTQKGNLNKHMQLHSSDGEAFCEYCHVRFTTYAAKMRHESEVHRNGWSESEDTGENLVRMNIQCDECPAKFRTERALRKHKTFHE